MKSSFMESLGGPTLWVAYALVAMMFLGAAFFAVMYHFGSSGEWKHSDVGRHLMAFTVSVAYFSFALLTTVAFGDYPGRTAVNLSAMAALMGVCWWRCIMYAVRWRKPRRAVCRDHL